MTTFNNPLMNNPFFIGSDEFLRRFNQALEVPSKLLKYPPFNVKKLDDNKYVIEMAVAGFSRQDIEVEFVDDTLVIKGNAAAHEDEEISQYLYKGIGERSFTRSFSLNENIEIKNAELLNGILRIALESIAPVKKSTKIEIKEEI